MPGEGRDPRAEAEALLEAHLPMLKGYLRHLVASPHDADDLAQDICVALLRDPQILLQGTDPAAYLRGIARHFANRHHRRVQRDPVLEAMMEVAWQEDALPGPAPEQKALSDCLQGLSEEHRRLVAWRYEQGLNSREIAERVRSSSDAIRMALVRARQSLARCLQGKLPMLEGGRP